MKLDEAIEKAGKQPIVHPVVGILLYPINDNFYKWLKVEYPDKWEIVDRRKGERRKG